MSLLNQLLTLCALCAAVAHGQRPVNEKQQAQCIADYKEQKPTLAARFTDKQIAWFCQNGKVWKAGASVKKDISQDQQMTTGQLDFLNRLRQCKGIKCLKQGGLKNVYRPRPPKPPPGVAADFPSTPDFLSAVYDKIEAFDAQSVRLDDHLADMRVHIIFDGVLYDSDHPLCDERVALAELCPQALEKAHFDKIIAMTPDGQPTANMVALQDLCNFINMELDSYGLDFKTFEACKSEGVLRDNRRTVALACRQITSATDGASAFPEYSERAAWLRSDGSKRTMADSLQERYEALKRHCEYIEQSMQDSGLGSMDSWLEGRRRRRQTDQLPDVQLLTNGLFYRPVQRKEYRALSAFERVRFHAALNQLKYEQIDGISKYDLLVLYHTPSESPGAYWGPAFLPHHREWLKALEIGLRLIDPAVAIPFWDSSLDEPLPQPKESVLWTDEFLGNGDGPVVTGDFQNWPATAELPFLPGTMSLYRDVGTSPFGGLYRPSDETYALAAAGYNELTACVDPTFELTQGLVHMFVGGYMADIQTSPNDPAFIVHHSYVDHLWEKFRQQKQTRQQRESDYPSDDMACTEHHYGSAQMKPFPITNLDGMSNIYTDEMYRYELVDTNEGRDCDFCSPEYMFCHPELNRCVSKIRPGGDCTGYSDNEGLAVDACYNSICSGDTNKCEPSEGLPVDKEDTATRPPVVDTTTKKQPPVQVTTPEVPPTEQITPEEPSEVETTTPEWPPVDVTTPEEPPIDFETPEPPIDFETPEPPIDFETPEPPIDFETPEPPFEVETTTPELPIDFETPEPPFEVETTTPELPVDVVVTTPEQPPVDQPTEPTEGGGGSDMGLPVPPAPEFGVVWFTFSVIRGTSVPANMADYQPVDGPVTITATGLSTPHGYNAQTEGVYMGELPNAADRPLYPYGAYVQVMDPLSDKYFKLVEFKLEASSAGGQCEMHCYLRLKNEYGKCPNRLRLSPSNFYSAPIDFSSDLDEALSKAWKDNGDKKKDYVVFVCP